MVGSLYNNHLFYPHDVYGKHYLYTHDSGGRGHTGWYCYETQMKGLIPRIWLCTLEEPEPQLYTGNYPESSVSKGKGKKADIIAWQEFLCWWGENVDTDGVFGNDTKEKTITFQKKYNIGKATGACGEKTIDKAKEIGASEKH